MTRTSDLAASVAARLLNRARETGDDHQVLLTSYCVERFLYRLDISKLRDLVQLRGGDGDFEAIREDLRAIVMMPVPPDAVIFAAERLSIEAIRAEDEYAGTRAKLTARCGKACLMLQIDMGVSDAVWPTPLTCVYPSLLGFPAPNLLAYRREAVVAEKLEAMVVLGDRNSRIKDFFDVHHLASRFEFDRATLSEAVRRAFERRHTLIPTEDPIGLTPKYWENPSRPAQVQAFVRRARNAAPDKPDEEFARLLHAFLAPVLEDLRNETSRKGTWRPGGPWR